MPITGAGFGLAFSAAMEAAFYVGAAMLAIGYVACRVPGDLAGALLASRRA